jgi:hypothetical protein
MGGNGSRLVSLDARDRTRADRQTRVPDERGLAATKHFRDFLMTSRPAPKQPEPKDKMLTLPELEAMLRAKEEQNHAWRN